MSGLVTFVHSGNFNHMEKFLARIKAREIYSILDAYGAKGTDILKGSTPVRTGATASSWYHRVVMDGSTIGIEWLNSNMANDGSTPVAILIQMGHGTGTGGYVPPTDYINPAMAPLFDEIVNALSEVVKAL